MKVAEVDELREKDVDFEAVVGAGKEGLLRALLRALE